MENNHFCKGFIINTELQVIDLVNGIVIDKFIENYSKKMGCN